jgi:hypothetical protein
MLTVGADAVGVEKLLRGGGLSCPDCAAAVVPWGVARPRWLRGVDGAVRLRPRRSRCTGCGATHVLLPLVALLRRAGAAAVIGTGLALKATGLGHRRIAAQLGRPAATVRGWLRRFVGRAEGVRRLFTTVSAAVDADPGLAAPADRATGHRPDRSSGPKPSNSSIATAPVREAVLPVSKGSSTSGPRILERSSVLLCGHTPSGVDDRGGGVGAGAGVC